MRKTIHKSRPLSLSLRLAKLENAQPRRGPLSSVRKEFHVSRASRKRFQFDQALYSISGNVILTDFQAVRIFAQKMNEGRGAGAPGEAVWAGALNAMGLIDEILHYVVSLYAAQVRPAAFRELISELEQIASPGEVQKALARFCRDFPPRPVYDGQLSVEEYLQGMTQGVPNRETAIEEMLLLWLANANPAFSPFRELFDDSSLSGDTVYSQLMDATRDFFSRQPPFGPDGQNLVDMLRSPSLAYPDSLSRQLQFIREKWGLLLGKFLERLLSGQDLIREDEKEFFPGPGPAAVFEPGMARQNGPGANEEEERFSPDRDWMPRLVLMAKTVYVWLDQLGKKYGRPITTLDGIPDEELDTLAHWGFTGLWLIGVWERSPASRRIKQKCGNPEAIASAYSLYRYEIAAELGGEAALENLKSRAWTRGIRLASDMVPNHMGIDSPWVVEHPEWFISLDHSPFPAYRFTGEDLSTDPRVGIFLEDHYFDRSDAAVVFKWVDRRSGRERYIYHGNDGTRMPWNDTAQLNYLRPDVREAVMQAILGVSRKFPIIRFDAAMTLARKHYQRLWFPQPGSGGDIPSRAGQGMSVENFNRVMPGEFWREVVDRMTTENPDTLLLAEAFWLMESYFVRTLGMHRVYNSAFMNFLKMEANAKFRQSLKNALEFNPEILRRFVNFMNNPDEETALAQFGSGDKYFGACTLLAALPGLPMFGHGQVEGFSEKYGMEYRRAYLDEQPDQELVRRHERQIFPLLRQRALFAGVEDFRLYDFFTPGGNVDENVVAFSNSREGQRGLVVFHNRYASTAGWIRISVAFATEDPSGGPRSLRQEDLGRGLGLRDEPGRFVVFRDLVSGLEYIRSCHDLCSSGMFIELGAYQAHVFLDFREMADDGGGRLARLAAHLGGRGCSSLKDVEQEMELKPLHNAWREVCRPGIVERLATVFQGPWGKKEENALWMELETGINALMLQAATFSGGEIDGSNAAKAVIEDLLALRFLFLPAAMRPHGRDSGSTQYLRACFRANPGTLKLFFLSIFMRRATGAGGERKGDSRLLAGKWRLETVMTEILRGMASTEETIGPSWRMLRLSCDLAWLITSYVAKLDGVVDRIAASTVGMVESMLDHSEVREALKVNRFQEIVYFERESFMSFCDWLTLLVMWEIASQEKKTGGDARLYTSEVLDLLNYLPALATQSGFKLEEFLKKLSRIAGK